jgi:acid phosphatase type 7
MDQGGAGFVLGAPGFEFGRESRSASEQLTGPKTPHEMQAWHDLPAPTGEAPYRLDLEAVLGKDAVAAIANSGRLVFHTVGDTGGIDNAWPRRRQCRGRTRSPAGRSRTIRRSTDTASCG